MKINYNKNANITLSPLFVSKSNERFGFYEYDAEYDVREEHVAHLEHYYDWFAHHILFKKELNKLFIEIKYNVHGSWYQLVKEKSYEEGLGRSCDQGYQLPIEGNAISPLDWGKFKEPPPKIPTEDDLALQELFNHGIICPSGVNPKELLAYHKANDGLWQDRVPISDWKIDMRWYINE